MVDGFRPNQILLVTIGYSRAEIQAAAKRGQIFIESTDHLVRFPLTPKDVRVVFGVPNEVQGLEAEVVVLAHWAGSENFGLGAARELYISMSRARSLLCVFSSVAESELATRAKNASSDTPPVET